jgi:acyl-CoA thioesterase
LFGGGAAAQIHYAAATHLVTDSALLARNQPDILSMHLEFLRPCERRDSIITVTTLKTGAVSSTIQLQLSQNGKIRIVALATSTNFDKVLGPSAATDWTLYPSPPPKPRFDRVMAQKPDDNWLPGHITGEIIPVTRRILILNPRRGHTVKGVCDVWNSFLGDERMDATYLAMMTDIMPSLSDTLLRNGGLYDGHLFLEKLQRWAEKHPGVPAMVNNTILLESLPRCYVTVEWTSKLQCAMRRWSYCAQRARLLWSLKQKGNSAATSRNQRWEQKLGAVD